MRIRSILPDFYRSQDVADLDWHHRLVFIGLWSYVDDNGVGRDSERLVASDLFPLDGDPTESLRRVSTALQALSKGGQIRRYVADGHRYLFVCQWDKYQRVQNPGKERYARPTCDSIDSTEVLQTSYVDSPESLSPGEGEKGRRGEGEKTCPAEPDAFDAWWNAYPRKDSKKAARKAYPQAVRAIGTPDELLRATVEWFDSRKIERQFMPMPASWLNGRRWEDEEPSISAKAIGGHPGDQLPW